DNDTPILPLKYFPPFCASHNSSLNGHIPIRFDDRNTQDSTSRCTSFKSSQLPTGTSPKTFTWLNT
ncbi:hypothetical protein J6590_065681, partial [Homalodisca vitripennis]